MNFEILKDILEKQARAEGLEKYEIYFTDSESVSTETLKD